MEEAITAPMRFLLAFTLALTGIPLQSQELPSKATSSPTGSVSGTVICSDTQAPARFAKVVLVNRNLPHFPTMDVPRTTLSITGLTGIDGHFLIDQVPPGDYYAMASVDGYIFPLTLILNESPSHPLAELLHDVPQVHVAASQTAQTEIALQRGGLIAGQATFEDGSPAAGLRVQLHAAEEEQSLSLLGPILQIITRGAVVRSNNLETDDEGRFRFSGLPPGQYRLSLSLTISASSHVVQGASSSRNALRDNGDTQSVVEIFYPGAFRMASGKVLKITGDERLSDSDIVISLKNLHTVRGTVRMPADLSTMKKATICLCDEDGPREARLSRVETIHPDGSFEFKYVPPGRYLAEVIFITDPVDGGKSIGAGAFTKSLEQHSPQIVVLDADVDAGEIPTESPSQSSGTAPSPQESPGYE